MCLTPGERRIDSADEDRKMNGEVMDRTRDAGTKKKGSTPVANDAGNILSQINEQEIEWVDLRFTDPKGKWQHLTMASTAVDEDQLTDGFMFDGSSIAGWKAINESDMILKPDLQTAYLD